jgi:hypothetical protein
VEAHAYAHLDAFRPLVPEQRPLRRRGGVDRPNQALRKTTKNESPLVSISIPPPSAKAARRRRLWVESTSR